jgi:hypothetical protein
VVSNHISLTVLFYPIPLVDVKSKPYLKNNRCNPNELLLFDLTDWMPVAWPMPAAAMLAVCHKMELPYCHSCSPGLKWQVKNGTALLCFWPSLPFLDKYPSGGFEKS